MPGPRRSVVCDRPLAVGEAGAVKQQQHPGAGPKRKSVRPAGDEWQPERLAVEALDLLALARVVIEGRLEHALEPRRRLRHLELRGPPGGIRIAARSRRRSPPPPARLRRSARRARGPGGPTVGGGEPMRAQAGGVVRDGRPAAGGEPVLELAQREPAAAAATRAVRALR